jgi:hypothetical protein
MAAPKPALKQEKRRGHHGRYRRDQEQPEPPARSKGSHGSNPRRLTDLELSGAPQLADREADRARPTRPLERLVRRHGVHATI